MSEEAKASKRRKSWAGHAVDSLTDEEVRRWCERLGIRPQRDTRAPVERLPLQPRRKAAP